MKKTIVIMLLALTATVAAAQPRAMGIRFGAADIDASYQHEINSKQFLEVDLGLDMGYNLNGHPGAKAAFTYNFIWAHPAWTALGCWSLYAGPGIAVGFTDDMVPYELEGSIKGYYDNGWMVAVAAQVGLEYMFEFPLALAIDVRPYFGIHSNNGRLKDPISGTNIKFDGKTGFYDNGLLGFIPSISVRYRF
jgi:hypothetical protein